VVGSCAGWRLLPGAGLAASRCVAGVAEYVELDEVLPEAFVLVRSTAAG